MQDERKLALFRKNVARLLRVHAIAQRHSVRGTESQTTKEAHKILKEPEIHELDQATKNLPLVVLTWLGAHIVKHRQYVVYDRVFEEMDKCIDELMEAWMGMHKLATTPMPFPFLQMLLGLMYLWMLTVPFPLAIAYGWAAPAISMLLGVALFGINAIGAELEDPLGEETNDLPLDVYEKAALQAAVANDLGWPDQPEKPAAAPAVVAVPDKQDVDEPAIEDIGESEQESIKIEILTKEDLGLMSHDAQRFFQDYFTRYDLNSNQMIDTENELRQLVTNINWHLKFSPEHCQWLNDQPAAYAHANPGFTLTIEQFVSWFCKIAQSKVNNQAGIIA